MKKLLSFFILSMILFGLMWCAKTANDYYNLGIDKYYAKKYDNAIRFYTKAIEIDPENYLIYVARAKARSAFWLFYGAIEDYSMAINLNKEKQPLTSLPYYQERGKLKLAINNCEWALQDFNNVGFSVSDKITIITDETKYYIKLAQDCLNKK